MQVLLEQAADNILAATAEHLAGQKEAALVLIETIEEEIQQTLARVRAVVPLPSPDAMQVVSVSASTHLEILSHLIETTQISMPLAQSNSKDWADIIQVEATVSVARFQLQDGTTGWSYEHLFPSKFLRGALQLSLVDPYFSDPHQLRNLKEFLLHVAEVAKPKAIEVVTATLPVDRSAAQDRVFGAVSKDLFEQFGVALTWKRDAGLHDRCLRLDHGVLFKLGRGLDVYKPALGLSAHRPASRHVRSTEIDVFAVPGHALVLAQHA